MEVVHALAPPLPRPGRGAQWGSATSPQLPGKGEVTQDGEDAEGSTEWRTPLPCVPAPSRCHCAHRGRERGVTQVSSPPSFAVNENVLRTCRHLSLC